MAVRTSQVTIEVMKAGTGGSQTTSNARVSAVILEIAGILPGPQFQVIIA
jgi:hypothetical protein